MKHFRTPGAWLVVALAITALYLSYAPSTAHSGAKPSSTKQTTKNLKASTARVHVYSCDDADEKRRSGAKILHRDPLNSGAWMVPGVDPRRAPIVSIWSCVNDYVEPSDQLRPIWRKKQAPPLGPARRFDICSQLPVKKIAKNRVWFDCLKKTTTYIRID